MNKKKSTRLSRWKAAMCLAVVAGASSVAHAQYAGPVVSPPSLAYGDVGVGTTSAVQTLTVSIAYGGKVVTGAQSAPKGFNFRVDSLTIPAGYARNGGTCQIGVGINTSCTIGIVFAPAAVGAQGGDIAITASSNGLPGTTNVPVTGTGVAGSSQGIPVLGNLGLLLMLAGLGGAGIVFARRH
jgi:hypothetical protein